MAAVRGWLVVWCALTLIACHSSPSQKLVHKSPLWIDGLPPPATVEGFVHQSSDVVRVRVVSVDPRNAPPPQPTSAREEQFGVMLLPDPFWRPPVPEPWSPSTLITSRIVAVYRTNRQLAPGDALTIRLDGGDIDRGDYIERVREPNLPDMEVTKEYIVFMASPTRPVGRYHGIFEVTGEKVRPFSNYPATRALQQLGTTELLRQLGDPVP